MNEYKAKPEKLLEAIQKINSQENRGKLRVFLGMCPGVGKTYAMLKAAQEQQKRSVKVAVGVVETHGRKETEELLQGLKIIPRKQITYKNTELSEMDLDLILIEKPQLVLVDELAHTNAPGVRHSKRYQDVEELLAAGMDVYTTINIQHIESRNDQVAQITGVLVRETVPDSIIEQAQQIEVIDLSPSQLLQRLREGKVYLGDRAIAAEKSFFKEEHLMALRELALRFTAEKVDQELHDQMLMKGIEGPWNTNERLLVAVSHSPYSAKLIRTAKRMAQMLEAPWIALYVDQNLTLSADDHEILRKNLDLAKKLGAEVITVADTNITLAIQSVCNSKNVTQMILGRPDRRFFRDFIHGGTLLDQLVKVAGDIDIHVVRTKSRRIKQKFFRWPQFRSGLMAYYHTSWLVIAMSLFCYFLLPYLGYQALGSFFLLFILGVASISSRGPIFFSALLSALIWNYFFIPPQFTFHISSTPDLMMVLSFFVTALVGGLLTSRIRRQESVLRAKEEKSQHLYEFVKSLATAKDEDQIIEVLRLAIQHQFNCDSAVLLNDNLGRLAHRSDFPFEENDFAVASWVFENNKPAGWSTMTLSGSKTFSLPMTGNADVIGVLIILPPKDQLEFTIDQQNFVETLILQAATTIERLRFQEGAKNAEIFAASEKLHQTLINSVSHELRTPITTILGTASALQEQSLIANEKTRNSLLNELSNSARRLDRVVENLLDMSRLETNTIQIKREWFEIRDLIEETVRDLSVDAGQHKIIVKCEGEILIDGDFKLLQHALSNILLNAIKYSEPNSMITVEGFKENNSVTIRIADEGVGIKLGEEIKIFEKFYRGNSNITGGIGLGLSIVKNIFELHGGSVKARNRIDHKGSIFSLSLPISNQPPQLQEMLHGS